MAAIAPRRSLRLTLVTETFAPEVNGVARTLHRWVEAFRSRGHHVQIIRPRQPPEGRAPPRAPSCLQQKFRAGAGIDSPNVDSGPWL